MGDGIKGAVTLFYYLIGAVAFVLTFVRVLYGWFKDYDNSKRFTAEMATKHLPYIYEALQTIGDGLGIKIKSSPIINFAYDPDHNHQA